MVVIAFLLWSVVDVHRQRIVWRKVYLPDPVGACVIPPNFVLPASAQAHVARVRSSARTSSAALARFGKLSLRLQHTVFLSSKEQCMKYLFSPRVQAAKTPLADVVRWAHDLARVHARIAP